jgi:hypothetical protein
MKRIVLFIVIITICSYTATAGKKEITEKKARALVTDFLKDMIAHSEKMDLFKYISPAYIQDNKIEIAKYNINTYYPVNFTIEKYTKKTSIVIARIWGKERKWVHKLYFKVVLEAHKLYLFPGKYSDDYIDPWYEVESYITE